MQVDGEYARKPGDPPGEVDADDFYGGMPLEGRGAHSRWAGWGRAGWGRAGPGRAAGA